MQSVWKSDSNIDIETPKSTGGYYFEDLNVGQHFKTQTHIVSEDDIKAFAAAFDPQPFHLDEQLARGTLFGGLTASGWHTTAITMRLLVDLGIPTGGLIGVGGEIALAATYPSRRFSVRHQ
ncbi:MAG: MaoC/PaaZ C-terminal domain-containing protein [Nitrosospira sp.]